MSRTRLVATLMCGLITVGILATPSAAIATSSPQQATQVVQLGTADVTKVTDSVESKTVALVDSSVSVTPYPSEYGSLSNISNVFYGSPGYWPGLCQANGIANCDAIQIGQQITVPTTAPVASAPVRASSQTASRAAAPAPQAQAANSSGAQAIVDFALAQVGKSYVWAAAGPWAFDCSGLVMQALAQVGVYVPHQDQGILYSGKGWPVSRDNLQPGDIVWPYNGHVFVYIGNGRIVEAASPRVGVIENNLYGFMAARRFV